MKDVFVQFAEIGPISVHFPERLETNAELQAEFPEWDVRAIAEKTGIHSRYIAASGETASDLAVAAAEKLFAEQDLDRQTIDFVLFCTQTPDYPLPTTACLIQHRLGLADSCGALDFNLGCSGFVYGMAIAEGLIRSGAARNILLLTAETYSKYIDADDRSLRTIFGDAAAATLVRASEQPSLRGFQFGTDGSGGDTLLVADGGARAKEQALQPRHRKRWKSRLYMDGPSLLSFTVVAVPKLIEQVLHKAQLPAEKVDLYLLHQATRKMLEQLQIRLGLDESRLPIKLEHCGNTVSSTLPILISDLRREGKIAVGTDTLLIGFGVGWSWAGCAWKETWQA
ncbi:MAG: ketoacyl-ACP synthase III [Planctomycetales bacterium]|nr:ketoacyl-ACP synthase III [Planctomycetales bacterium]